jgi:ribosomal protein L16 Arg81 hydroxylase
MPELKNLDKEWINWILQNIVNDVSEQKIVNTLIKQGHSNQEAKSLIDSVKSDPLFFSYKSLFSKKRKLENWLDVENKFKNIQKEYDKIEKIDFINAEAFFSDYFFKNKPVVIKNWTNNWKSLTTWDLKYFKENFGNETVEITLGRQADDKYDQKFSKSRKKILFGDFIDMISNNSDSNNFYLVARNLLLSNPKFKKLFEDFSPIENIIDPIGHNGNGFVKLWIGPKGTVSNLHHDSVNVLLIQVKGRKLVKFIPPNQTHKVYNNYNVFSDLNLNNEIDLKKYPLAKNLNIIDVIVNPGEALLIPVGWWHWIKSLDVSFTITQQKFCIPEGNVFFRHEFVQ